MSDDLFSFPAPSASPAAQLVVLAQACALCVAATGEYNWGNLCCRARFVTGLPGIDWRRGWMDRWKARESPDFYAAIERAVKTAWENKTGAVNV